MLISRSINGEVVEEGKMEPEDARFWAKRNCRRCDGRGILTFFTATSPPVETIVACSCVDNRMERAERLH